MGGVLKRGAFILNLGHPLGSRPSPGIADPGVDLLSFRRVLARGLLSAALLVVLMILFLL